MEAPSPNQFSDATYEHKQTDIHSLDRSYTQLRQAPSNAPSSSSNNDTSQHRSIDDFLEELYQEYKSKLTYGLDEDICEGDGGSKQRTIPADITQQRSNSTHNTCWCIRRIFHCIISRIGYTWRSVGRCLPLPLLALCIANSSDATEILMLSYLLANPAFREEMFATDSDLDQSSSMDGAEYLASSIFLGMLLGGALLGFLSDNIGRQPTLLIGLLTNATSGMLSSLPFLTPTFKQLTMWRFIAGIGIGATVPPLFSLASEWSPKEIRGSVVTTVASFWMVGSLFVSGLAWCLFHGTDTQGSQSATVWRVFAALCALPSALGAGMVYMYVPESPRFLSSGKHDFKQSALVCNQMAMHLGVKVTATNDGGTPHSPAYHAQPLAEEEVRQHSSGTKENSLVSTSLFHKLSQTIHSLNETLRKLYSPQLCTQTTMPLQLLWFSLSFGTYGITTWINTLFVAVHLENLYFNSFLFALANLPGNVMSMMYSDKWGRSRMLIGSLLGAASSLISFAMVVYLGNNDVKSGADSNQQANASHLRTIAILICACAFQMFSIVSWNAIDILSGELFPTRVRSAGMGVCTASGRLGAMVAQIANAHMMSSVSDEGEEESVASAWVLVVAALALLLGAGMPSFLGRDVTGGELKDEVVDASRDGLSLVGCGGRRKDHLSDDEMDTVDALRGQKINEYQSFREEVEANEPFLL